MLSCISGKQRAGKTYFAVTLIIDILLYTDRNVYTNLPLFPDRIASFVAGRHKFKIREILSRIFLFCDKADTAFLDYVKNKSPLYFTEFSDNLISSENLRVFYEHCKPNSFIIFDEVYEIFSSQLFKESGSTDIRLKLLTYTRQHGHRKDDLVFISHNPNDLDVFIRRGIMYMYEIRNSKYTNMLPFKIFRGLRFPIQFFIIKGYEYGESEPSDSFCQWPSSKIFSCYDSFSVSKVVGFDRSGVDGKKNLDSKIDHKGNLRNFFRQFRLVFFVLIGCVVGLYFAISTYKKMFFGTKIKEVINEEKKIESKPESEVKESDKVDKSATIEKMQVDIAVISVNSSCITFSDGLKIRVGEIFKGVTIEKINKQDCLVSIDNKQYTVSFEGLRK
jgi:hypothetical protein